MIKQNKNEWTLSIFCMLLLLSGAAQARRYHVSGKGNDAEKGTAKTPFQTISRAAEIAGPGDVITVHEGVYRERINPARGGRSDRYRIVYRAAPGEKVVVKGSEVIKGWRKVQNDTWKVSIANSFFGDFNPYSDLIHGDWFNPKGRAHHTGAVYLSGHWLTEAANYDDVLKPIGETGLWFGKVEEANTTIWAQFAGVNPNEAEVEINVRRAVFYPDKPGVNYIAVRGFIMMHAATPWAPPTAEQIGLIGTHWSKGWVIENNTIRYSICTGVTLGKHGDKFDNTSANTAEGYVKTIERATARGWSKDNIGHHVVRNNHISHCEQAGIVGSMGAVFCTVAGNTIHDINFRGLFGGAEMAGIKFHGAIDTLISRNHVFRCGGLGGIWLDWMAQGTRVTGNLLHDNTPQDLFVEVNHGPFLVDNNLFLSPRFLRDWSQGGAYVHNLATGSVEVRPQGRKTPFHKPHSTEVVGLESIACGDDRFYNNIFIGHQGLLSAYDRFGDSIHAAGNVYLMGAKASQQETDPIEQPQFDPGVELVEKPDGIHLRITLDESWAKQRRPLVTTKLLGKARVPQMLYERPDGSPYRIDTDYFGRKRHSNNPFPGPFEPGDGEKMTLKVWP